MVESSVVVTRRPPLEHPVLAVVTDQLGPHVVDEVLGAVLRVGHLRAVAPGGRTVVVIGTALDLLQLGFGDLVVPDHGLQGEEAAGGGRRARSPGRGRRSPASG